MARGTGTQRTFQASSHAARLAAVARHADYPAALAFVPPPPSAWHHCVPGVMVLIGVLAVGRAVTLTDDLAAAALAMFLVLPWFVVAIVLGRDLWRRRSSKLRARIARVVSSAPLEHEVETRGAAVELHFEDGAHSHLSCHPGLSAALAVDDVGVAYEVAGRLVAFRRFDL